MSKQVQEFSARRSPGPASSHREWSFFDQRGRRLSPAICSDPLPTELRIQEQALEFSIRWEADLNKWLERGGALFDQRKTIPYGTMQDLASAARRILAPAWTSGDPQKIGPAMAEFL